MANKVPVKAIFSGSDVSSLGEFATSDTIAAIYINGVPTGSLALAGGTMLSCVPSALKNGNSPLVTVIAS